MYVLGIETSCDETGVAVYHSQRGLISHRLYSQVALHAPYGGIVPELASRDHVRKLLPLIRHTLVDADLSLEGLDGVAYTAGPGLIGALLVGASAGHSLAWSLDIPVVAVHHMEGHLLAPMLETPNLRPPFLALLISGGHTLLIEVRQLGEYRLLGESIDDAVGEAFDKVAKMLDLGYPGGPALEKLARQGNPERFGFPRPMCDRPGLDFSFSGLKTFTLNTLATTSGNLQDKADIARGFQDAVADTLAIKCRRALRQTKIERLVVAGGVCANQAIRKRLAVLSGEENTELFLPRAEFCTDNGAMIAFAGCLRLRAGQHEGRSIVARARWNLEELPPISLQSGLPPRAGGAGCCPGDARTTKLP